jgi:hypothetical protein
MTILGDKTKKTVANNASRISKEVSSDHLRLQTQINNSSDTLVYRRIWAGAGAA